MKAILRKGMAACAAVLVSANVMAQSLDFIKEFQEDYWPWGIKQSLMKDDKPRLIITEQTSREYISGLDYSYSQLNKLSILDKNLSIEKEFTSGPLFEEFEDMVITSAPKTLKVASVDTVYSEDEAKERFYSHLERLEGFSYNEMIATYGEDESTIRFYVDDYIKKYHLSAVWTDNEETTFKGARMILPYGRYRESSYYDWGKQYPTEGWIYKDYDEVYYVEINYVADELEELERNSAKGSIYNRADITYFDYIVDAECSAVISQSLFNDDEKYEFLLPELAVFESSSENWNGNVNTTYLHRPIGFKIVSEDGVTLHSLILNEEKNPDMRCYAYVTNLDDKTYLMVNYYASGEENDYDVTRFYEIKKDGSGTNIQKVREMRGGMNIRPTVANRDEQITITLDEENSSVARELVVTGVNGQLVGRRTIPAGENTIQVNAAMMRSGMYNFTLQKKGQVVDNGKVIVK